MMAEPASPCTGVCLVDPLADLCGGCGRTLDEIAAWFGATPLQKQAILSAAKDRRLQLASQARRA